MTHRPYPSPDRARHQLDRHADETPPLTGRHAEPRQVTPFEQRLIDSATATAEALRPQLQAMGKSLLAAFQPRPQSSEETTG